MHSKIEEKEKEKEKEQIHAPTDMKKRSSL
jgi:hypothetical protein